MMYTPANAGPPNAEHMAEMDRFIEESRSKGELLATGGLFAGPKKVRLADGKLTVTDGPYAETKEVIAGFALIQLESPEAAIESAKRFLQVAGDGVSEIHRIAGPEDFAC
jgi:hypothetical protein